MHLTAVIPYLRSTKIIVDRFITENPNIPKRLHEHYHRVANDEIIKSIFNSGKNKERYISVFEVDVPMTQSQLIESTQETHKTPSSPRPPNLVEHQGIKSTQGTRMTPSAPRPPNHVEYQGESSAPRKSTITEIPIRRQSDPETLILTFDEIDVTNLDEATQVSIAITKSLKDFNSLGNVKTVKEPLVEERDKEKIVKVDDKLEPESHKESPEEEKSDDVLIINDDDEEEESVEDALIRKKGKAIRHERQRVKDDIATMVDEAVQKERENIWAELSGHVTNDVANIVPAQIKDNEQAQQAWLSLKIKFERPTPLVETCRATAVRTHDHEDHHDDDARPEGKSRAKRQRTSEHGTYSMRESSYSQAMDETNHSGSGNQEQLDEFDAWMVDFGTNDDEVPSEKVSPELLEEVSVKVDELQMQNVVNDMLRERCNSGKEHQYHFDQMKNYMKSDIVWENRKEDLSLQIPVKPAPVYQSCERDPKAQPMTLINQDLFYLKHSNSGSKKYVLLLHKYHAVPFPNNDLVTFAKLFQLIDNK
ncbi:hypothetical protein Tco_1374628, partial [Tanacetum coccineum]